MVTGKRVTRGKFKIGDWVTVRATVEFVRDGNKRKAKRAEQKLTSGQVVGVVTRMEGEVDAEYEDDGPYGGEGQLIGCYLAVSAQHELWEVRLGMKNRPVLAFEADVEPCGFGDLPWLKINGYKWTTADRKRQREESKAWPRGKNGRWASESVAKAGAR